MKELKAYINKINTSQLLVFLIVGAMFLPRVVKKGMFGDGLLYASIARNMSEGRGSIWEPFFSSSYWLENVAKFYYENPPLMLWVESILFQITGDHWWVEKLFSCIVFIINVLLFKLLWDTYFLNNVDIAKYWVISILTWYLIPVVIWGNVNNLMDNFLLSFCLSALICFFKYQNSNNKGRNWWLLLASLFIFLGILVKGPVALFPLAAPFLHWICFKKVTFKNMLSESIIVVSLTLFIFFGFLMVNQEALSFFEQYWEQRLKAVLTGSREDMKLDGWGKVYILQQLCLELSPTFFVLILAWIYSKIKPSIAFFVYFNRDILFFTLLGLAATLPILFSTKQSGIYLIPGIPMFSIAAAIFLISIFKNYSAPWWHKIYKLYINSSIITLIIIVLLFSTSNFGKMRREAKLITDIEQLKSIIPDGSQIAVCDTMMKDFVLHTYMQRMGKYELSVDSATPLFYLSNDDCIDDMNNDKFSNIEKENFKYFSVYRRKN